MVLRKRACLVLVVGGFLFCANVALAQPKDPESKPVAKELPLDPKIVKYLDAAFLSGEESKEIQIGQLRFEAKRLRLRNRRTESDAIEKKAEQVAAELRITPDSFEEYLSAPFALGQLGFVLEDFDVISIVDGSNLIAMAESHDGDFQTVWISGCGTKNLTSDSTFQLPEGNVYKVSGTKEYETARGTTNRVLHIESIDTAPYLKKYKEQLAEKQKPDAATAPEKKPEPADVEKRASAKLRLANQLLKKGETAEGKDWLNGIIRDYPGTESAKEAQRKLDSLK